MAPVSQKTSRPGVRGRKQSFVSAHGALVFVSLLALMLAQTNIPALEAGLVQGRWAPLILLAAWPVGRWALRSGWEGPSIRRLRGFDCMVRPLYTIDTADDSLNVNFCVWS